MSYIRTLVLGLMVCWEPILSRCFKHGNSGHRREQGMKQLDLLTIKYNQTSLCIWSKHKIIYQSQTKHSKTQRLVIHVSTLHPTLGIAGIESKHTCWYQYTLCFFFDLRIIPNKKSIAHIKNNREFKKYPSKSPHTNEKESELTNLPHIFCAFHVYFNHWSQRLPQGGAPVRER